MRNHVRGSMKLGAALLALAGKTLADLMRRAARGTMPADDPTPTDDVLQQRRTPPRKTKVRKDRQNKRAVTIHLEPEVHEGIRAAAGHYERSVENLLRRALQRLVEDHQAGKADRYFN